MNCTYCMSDDEGGDDDDDQFGIDVERIKSQ